MAKVTVGYHPQMRKTDAIEIFQNHFAGKYAVVPPEGPSGRRSVP